MLETGLSPFIENPNPLNEKLNSVFKNNFLIFPYSYILEASCSKISIFGFASSEIQLSFSS